MLNFSRIPLGDSSDEEDEVTTKLIAKSKKLVDRRQKIAKEAELETKEANVQLSERMDEDFVWKFPSDSDLKKEGTFGLSPQIFTSKVDEGRDIAAIKERISTVVGVLGDFKKLQYKETPRSAYMELLKADLSFYYGYLPYLVEKILQLFPPAEVRSKDITNSELFRQSNILKPMKPKDQQPLESTHSRHVERI